MQELLEKAEVAEVTQHVPIADEILGSDEAQKIVAFLLNYIPTIGSIIVSAALYCACVTSYTPTKYGRESSTR